MSTVSLFKNKLSTITIVLGFLIALSLCFPLVKPVSSQNDMKITFEPENWTEDMKRVKMTTYERGLKIRIDITNLDKNDYLDIDYLSIRIEIRYEEEDSKDFDFVELGDFSVRPDNTTSTFRDIDLHHMTGSLGKWALRLGYVTSPQSSGYDYNKIEPYPFEFKVASEEELQKAIEENPSGFVFSPTFNITISFVTVGGISLILFYLMKKKKFKLKF